jgi:hypothetical protein
MLPDVGCTTQLKLGTYSYQGAIFPDVRCTAAPLDTEEDSRYPRNAIGTRTTTYRLPNTWEYQAVLLKSSVPDENAHWYLQYTELAGEIVTSRGLKLRASLSLSPTGLLLEIWTRGTYTAHICDHHQAIGPAANKEEAHKG